MKIKLKNKYGLYLIMVLFGIMLIQIVSANFACGEVINSDDNMSAAWFNIRLFFPNDNSKYSDCDISPDQNKFCCDTEAIPGRAWKIGDVISAEIFDSDMGYVSGPVTMSSTGEGYDVFPLMKLEKVINHIKPIKRFIVSNTSEVELNLKIKSPYNNISILGNGNSIFNCSNCSEINKRFNFGFGMNTLKINVNHEKRNILENKEFAIVRGLELNRQFLCNGCNKNKIRADRNINVTIKINLSNEVKDMSVFDIFPKDFQVIDLGLGKVSEYSESHNKIVWNFSGNEITKSYIIKYSAVKIISTDIIFRTEIETENISEKSVSLIGFLPIVLSKDKLLTSKTTKNTRTRIYVDKPLVLRPKNEDILRIGVYPTKTIKDAEFKIVKIIPEKKLSNGISYYKLSSNLNTNDIKEIYVESRIKKSELRKNGFFNVSLYYLKNSTYSKAKMLEFKEDNKYLYFKSYIPNTEMIVYVGEGKLNLFEKIGLSK